MQLTKLRILDRFFPHPNGKGNNKLLLPEHVGASPDFREEGVIRVTPEELFGLRVATPEEQKEAGHDYILTYPYGADGPNSVGVHWGIPPLDQMITYTEWAQVLFPSVEFDHSEYKDHQESVRFGNRFSLFQQATNNYVSFEAGRTRGRYSIITAPADSMIKLKGGKSAMLYGYNVGRVQYPFLVRAALFGQPWNPSIQAYPKVNMLRAASPHSVEHTARFTIVNDEWAYAYWRFQMSLVDLPRLLDTDLTLLFIYHKEFHPDKVPSGKRKVRDFLVTVIARKQAPLNNAEAVFRDTATDELKFIRGGDRLTGKGDIKALFQATTPGYGLSPLDLRIRWGQYPLKGEKEDKHDNWRIFMNQTVTRNQQLYLTGPALNRNSENENPLRHHLVAIGVDELGRAVFYNWFDKNVIAAQETKSGKSAWLLWQLFQWFGKNVFIFHYTGATDEAAVRLVEAFGGKFTTVPHDGIFVDSEDPAIQKKREKEARQLAQTDHDLLITRILETGALDDFPMLYRPAFENRVYNHYATRRLTLLREDWKDLSAVQEQPEHRLPNIFAGKYLATFLDNASFIPVVMPPPSPETFYPWREIENSVNQGLNNHFATWVALHNPQLCPPGFVGTFNIETSIRVTNGRYHATLTHPGDPKPLIPEVDIHLPPSLKLWVARQEA